jgi:RNA polymerase-binding transcription factor DksA
MYEGLVEDLRKERNDIAQRIDSLQSQVDKIEPCGDWVDNAQSSQTKEYLLGQIQKYHQDMKEIDDALARATEPGFGFCVVCGCRIPRRRIIATRGKAACCILCQERKEKQQARRQYS